MVKLHYKAGEMYGYVEPYVYVDTQSQLYQNMLEVPIRIIPYNRSEEVDVEILNRDVPAVCSYLTKWIQENSNKLSNTLVYYAGKDEFYEQDEFIRLEQVAAYSLLLSDITRSYHAVLQ